MSIPRTWQATLLLIGTIVGVGMFAIPFVFVQAGFLTGVLVLIGLAAAATLVHLAYAEIVLATPALHRLPGYVRYYLGPGLGTLSTASYLFGLSGALLAYVVLGGSFLGELLRWLLPSLPALAGPTLFYLFGIAVIFRGIRFESFTNAILTAGLMLAVALLALGALPALEPANLAGPFAAGHLFIPYGVVLFALAGATIIPDMRRVLGGNSARRLRTMIIAGTLAPAALYLLFAIAVVGATGAGTTPDAISGLAVRFGEDYRLLGALIGFLATITSFITLGLVFEGMFVSDFGFVPRSAWLATVVIPAALYLVGFQDFIAIIRVVGAVAIGFDSLLILFVHRRAVRRAGGISAFFPATAADMIRLLLVLIFAFGILYELYRFSTQ